MGDGRRILPRKCRGFALRADGAYDFYMTADAQKARFVCGRAVDDVPCPRKCRGFALHADGAYDFRMPADAQKGSACVPTGSG